MSYPMTPRRRLLREAVKQWAEEMGHPFPEVVADAMLKVDAEMRSFVAAGRGSLAEAAQEAARRRGISSTG